MQTFTKYVGLGMVLLFGATGCSSLAQPFDQLKANKANVIVYRLQNFEPPAPTAATPQAGAGAIALPPQIQQLITGAAALLPPNLIPPGLLPGSAVPAAPAAQTVARFHTFRILGYMQLSDVAMTDEVYDIFGKEKNFEAPKTQCMYAEFGFSFQQQGQQNDILTSLSCSQVQTFNFAWPHNAKTGLAGDTAKRIIAIAQKSFGG